LSGKRVIFTLADIGIGEGLEKVRDSHLEHTMLTPTRTEEDDDCSSCSCNKPVGCADYPPGFIPEAAVRARSSGGDVTYCPLNFTQSPPNAEDVIDAERVDQLLGIVARRFALAREIEPQDRIALNALAARIDTGDAF
jgi:hypothetical protein